MSLAGDAFTVESTPIGSLDNGTSVLLTGDDAAALESVFYQLVAPDDDERSVVLATEDSGRAVRRALDGVRRGSGSRASVLAAKGRGDGDTVRAVSDLADLTRLGMDFTSLVASAQQGSGRFRSGILLCSRVCDEAADMRSVYRLLNSNFLSELRRGDGIGICAIDTSADIGTSMDSVVKGMNTSFKVHIHVEKASRREVTLSVSGRPGGDETLTMSL